MIPYLITFGISIGLFYSTQKYKFPKYQERFIIMLAVVIPCILAALRAETIGTDVLVYAKPLFDRAVGSQTFIDFYSSSIYNYISTWNVHNVSRFEIGYLIIVYVIAKTTRLFPVLLFVTQLIINLLIYKGLEKSSIGNKAWVGMLIFYFMVFNRTLNLMRQSMAIAVIVFAFHYLENKSYKKYILCILISLLFHTSGLMGLVIFLMYYVMCEKKTNHRILRLVTVSLAGVIIIISLNYISTLLSYIGLGHYKSYINGTISFMPRQILLRVPIFVIYFMFRKQLSQKSENADYFFLLMFFDLLASQLSSVNEVSGRISLFFSVFALFVYAEIWNVAFQKENRFLIKFLILGYIAVFWYYQYVYMGYNHTVPYQFCF